MSTIDRQFQDFNEKNPKVFKEFCRYALQLKQKGFKHYGARAILNYLRFHTDLYEMGARWKLNNNVTPILARKAMQTHPELEGFFETRPIKIDGQPFVHAA